VSERNMNISKLSKLLGLSPSWAEPVLYFNSSPVTTVSRGQTAVGELDFETVNYQGVQIVLGHGHPTTLEVVTINSAGGTGQKLLQVWKLTAPTTSVSISVINIFSVAGSSPTAPSYFYRACGPFGWILAPAARGAAWDADVTATFRENVLA